MVLKVKIFEWNEAGPQGESGFNLIIDSGRRSELLYQSLITKNQTRSDALKKIRQVASEVLTELYTAEFEEHLEG